MKTIAIIICAVGLVWNLISAYSNYKKANKFDVFATISSCIAGVDLVCILALAFWI